MALVATINFAQLAFPCGQYIIGAKVKMMNGLSTLVVYPNTDSEINLKVDFNESIKLTPYLKRTVEVRAKINEEMDFTIGKIAKIESIKEILSDPLASDSGTYFKQSKIENCLKNSK